MTTIGVLLSLWTLLAVPVQTPPAAPAPPKLPEALASQVKLLHDGSKEEKRAAIKALCDSHDDRVLPVLEEALGKEEGDIRRMVVLGLVQCFPKQALPTMRTLLESGNPTARESASYGIGMVDDPSVLPLALSLLNDDQEKVRQGAVFSLLQPCRIAVQYARAWTLEPGANVKPVPPELLERVAQIRQAVLAKVLASKPPLALEPFLVLRRIIDHAAAKKLLENWRTTLPKEQKELGELLANLQERNRAWLGSPTLPRVDEIHYGFTMTNLFPKVPKDKQFPVRFKPQDLFLLRYLGVDLQRGTNLRLTLDDLVQFPQLCSPVLVKKDEGHATIRYDIPLRDYVSVGMGSFNLFYMLKRATDVSTGQVVLDTKRGVPMSEDLLSKDGKVMAHFDYADFREIEPGNWVPMRIDADLPANADNKRHFRYSLNFQLAGDGQVWIYASGTAVEITEDGSEVLRATSGIEQLTITPSAKKKASGSSPAAPPKAPSPEKKPASRG